VLRQVALKAGQCQQLLQAYLVHRHLEGQRHGDGLAFQAHQAAGRTAGLHGVGDQQVGKPLQVGQQVQAHHPAVHDLDVGRKPVPCRQTLSRPHPQPFILQQDVA